MKIPLSIKKLGRRGRAVLVPIGNPRLHLITVVSRTGKELHFTDLAIEQLKDAAQNTIRESWPLK
jgi:hypothetical protein